MVDCPKKKVVLYELGMNVHYILSLAMHFGIVQIMFHYGSIDVNCSFLPLPLQVCI